MTLFSFKLCRRAPTGVECIKWSHEVVGISMGTDPAPCIENLYLHYYEANWMKGLAIIKDTTVR